MCYYTDMEKGMKIAIGAGAGYFIWSKFKGVITLMWLIFVIFVIWAVVSPEETSKSDARTTAIKSFDEARYDAEMKAYDLRRDRKHRIHLEWAKTADLDAVMKSLFEFNLLPREQEALRLIFADCREAVRLNSIDIMDGIGSCSILYSQRP